MMVSNNQYHKIMHNFQVSNNDDTSATISKVDKMSQTSFTDAISEISSLPSSIGSQKEALALHVEKLDAVHSRVFGRWLMSEEEKAVIHEFQTKQKEAVAIILDQRNKSLEMFSRAGLEYTQRFIEKMLEMTGSTNEAQTSAYVSNVYVNLMAELEKTSAQFMNLYESKLKDQSNRSSELQGFIEGQKKVLLERFYQDWELLLTRFAKIIRTKVA